MTSNLEKPIHRLAQLEKAMSLKEYNLFVEKHSSSYGLLTVSKFIPIPSLLLIYYFILADLVPIE